MKSWTMRSSNGSARSEQDSLPGYGASLCVRVVDPFLYGLHQDSAVPERTKTIIICSRPRVFLGDGERRSRRQADVHACGGGRCEEKHESCEGEEERMPEKWNQTSSHFWLTVAVKAAFVNKAEADGVHGPD